MMPREPYSPTMSLVNLQRVHAIYERRVYHWRVPVPVRGGGLVNAKIDIKPNTRSPFDRSVKLTKPNHTMVGSAHET